MMNSKWIACCSAALALGVMAMPAHADYYLDSSAKFYSWKGEVGSDTHFTSTINGQVVCPDAGCGTGVGIHTDPGPPDPFCVTRVSVFCKTGNRPSVTFSYTDSDRTPVMQPVNFLALTGFKLDANVSAGNSLKLGDTVPIARLTYQNGAWFLGTPELAFSIFTSVYDCGSIVNSCFSTPLSGSWSDTLYLTVTPNTGTPVQNADKLCFRDNPQFGCFSVWEPGDTMDPRGEVELLGRIGSLTPVGFGRVISGGFLSPVPEPATAWLLVAGLGALGAAVRHRGANSSSCSPRTTCGRTDDGRFRPFPGVRHPDSQLPALALR